MKKIILLMALTAGACLVSAQENIPQEEAERFALKLIEQTAGLQNAQLKIEPDASKSTGFKASNVGMMLVPDKNLTEEALDLIGKEPLPLGQLWLRNIAPARNGKVTPPSKLRPITITADNREHHVTLYLLGVRKNAETLELVVYGKEKEPLLALPLKKAPASHQLPIEVSAEKKEEKAGELTFNVLGRYQATLTVMEQAE